MEKVSTQSEAKPLFREWGTFNTDPRCSSPLALNVSKSRSQYH